MLLSLVLLMGYFRPWNSDVVSAVFFGCHWFQEFEHVVVSSVVYRFKFSRNSHLGLLLLHLLLFTCYNISRNSHLGMRMAVSAAVNRF
jgi:hypothetical protein